MAGSRACRGSIRGVWAQVYRGVSRLWPANCRHRPNLGEFRLSRGTERDGDPANGGQVEMIRQGKKENRDAEGHHPQLHAKTTNHDRLESSSGFGLSIGLTQKLI